MIESLVGSRTAEVSTREILRFAGPPTIIVEVREDVTSFDGISGHSRSVFFRKMSPVCIVEFGGFREELPDPFYRLRVRYATHKAKKIASRING